MADTRPVVLVEVRDVYGTPKVYPADDTARTFTALTRTKTFRPEDLDAIRTLGYTILVDSDVRLPDGYGPASPASDDTRLDALADAADAAREAYELTEKLLPVLGAVANIRSVLAVLDSEDGDRQAALEAIDRIVNPS
jgi:hypothetical protein